ncbi:DnaB-like helicase C-terminal domain-containing protein [Polaribacter litorisediminis]|uniref:DnaB-like helicase C-terminal domain-containing protein n=1 Tax=Polaribacter litorisediminis TaxID=1908341 RepID=UPI001CBCE8CD|nr:DnaB-like helicase C-terminal domain-containing protein [Polaribacter litorisediminis]UAM99099.1 DnaB-like helicase C-terminal domain-containing protein [Polaribacter litorisediminis]
MKTTTTLLKALEKEPNNNREDIKTSFPKFDKFTKGLQPGQLILMAGRPGMGNLTFVKCLVLNTSIRHQNPVAVFSLEQTAETYLQKMIATEAGISYIEVQRQDHSEETTINLNQAINKIEKAAIFINDELEFSLNVISSKITELKNAQDIKLVMIHGYELVTYQEYAKDSRKQELDTIAKQLKILAEELNITIIITHQLSDISQAHSHKEVLPSLKEIYQDTPIAKVDTPVLGGIRNQ